MNPEIAMYYPSAFWLNGNWIKNLILFFDGIGILVPKEMNEEIERFDPAIVNGLKEHNLLHIIEPQKAIDKILAQELASILTDIIVSGALDKLAREKSDFGFLYVSKLGFGSETELAQMIIEELKRRGLASDSGDEKKILIHPKVSGLILTFLAHLIKPYGTSIELNLNPVTDRHQLVGSLREILSLNTTPSSGNVISFDLNTVSADLGAIPLDEVLDFRSEHIEEFKKYQLNCKSFAYELSRMSTEERMLKFDLRQEELNDLANQLRKKSRFAWKKPASFALTIAGAAWTLGTGDLIGGLIAASGGLLGIEKNGKEVGAYSYLFRAHERW